MSGNKNVRQSLEEIYGKKCMMEAAHIRYIPMQKRKKIKGYKRTDEMITYHHLIPKSEKGKTTKENGVLLKSYNHKWLEKQKPYIKEKINNELRRYKRAVLAGVELTGDGRIGNQVMIDLDEPGECIEIPLYPNKEEKEEKEESANPDDIIRARMEECWYK